MPSVQPVVYIAAIAQIRQCRMTYALSGYTHARRWGKTFDRICNGGVADGGRGLSM